MKRVLSLLLFAAVLLSLALPLSSCGGEVNKLYIYNWGEYMPLGGDDSEDVIALFEEYYAYTFGEEIEVVYSIFASNEEMYAKLKTGSSKIDLIIPSDYMIERLIAEDRLSPLDFNNIPHFENINPRYRAPDYDPNTLYSVPFTVGLVGLIYNTTMVDPTDFEDPDEVSWRILWDEKYQGNILTFNNSRDAFGIPQYILSAEKGVTSETDNYVNTTIHSRWDESLTLLHAQKPFVQAYVMDEVFNKMESGAAALAPYYAGDFLTMWDENEDLAFVYPKEGTNIFIDAMCVPKGAQNKLAAERFIDFMLMTDADINGESYNIAKEVAEYICYATPNDAVVNDPEYMFNPLNEDDPEYAAAGYEILYPELDEYPVYYFHNLDSETLDYVNSLWEQLKIESAGDLGIYISAGAIVSVIAATSIFLFVRKKKREKHY